MLLDGEAIDQGKSFIDADVSKVSIDEAESDRRCGVKRVKTGEGLGGLPLGTLVSFDVSQRPEPRHDGAGLVRQGNGTQRVPSVLTVGCQQSLLELVRHLSAGRLFPCGPHSITIVGVDSRLQINLRATP